MSIRTKISSLIFILAFLPEVVTAQNTVSGNVNSSDTGEGLPGVTVIVKGTGKGTTTDINGDFNIEVEVGAVLSFSYLGYVPQALSVGNMSKLVIVLEPDVEALDEVIVTGYSMKSKKELSASLVSIDAKALKGVTASDVGSLLQGKVAGLTVNSGSGAPGAAPDLRLRGITSINADLNPLFVVDGMIGGNFVPTNVETVTVLKDAAAIGLYGSAGAAGVIIITTKKATSDVPEFNFSARLVRKEITTGNFNMMDGATLYDTHEKMWGDDAIGFLKLRPEDLRDQNFDWLGESFNPGWIRNYTMGYYARSKSVNYAFDVDYFDEDGTFKNTDYQRLNLHAAAGYNSGKRLSINSDVNVQFTRNTEHFYGWFQDAFWSMPWDNPYDEAGDPIFLRGPEYDAQETPWYGQFLTNPFNSMQYNKIGNQSMNLFWSTRAVLEVTDWLSVETRTRVSTDNSRYTAYYAATSSEGIGNSGEIYTTQSNGYGVLSTHMLRMSKDFGDHTFGGFLAHEGGYSFTQNLATSGWNISPGIEVPSGAADPNGASGRTLEGRGISYISEISHGFKGKYFTNVVYRIDGSSNFAAKRKYGAFPSVSFAWLMSEEGFLKGSNAIDLLKIRTSYGRVGNDGSSGLDEFAFLSTYAGSGQYNSQPASSPEVLGNDKLGWETTTMFNLGVDIGLLKGDMAITVDVYDKNVDGMLFRRFLAPSSGFESRWENIGAMNNRGIELALNYRKSFGDFSYTGSINMSYNKNEMTEITDVIDSQELLVGDVRQINQVGESAFSWYMPKWLGVDPSNGAPMWEQIITDDNGNEIERVATSTYTDATNQLISSALPTVSGGFSNTFAYKGLSLSVLLTYQGGNTIYNRTRFFVDHDGANTGINFMELQDGWSRWEQPGDIATHPVLEKGDTDNAHFTSSRFVEKGDYLRVRNITLAYNLPQSWVSKLGMRDASLSIGIDNFFTFTEFSGMDPDIDINNSEFNLPGMSYLKYPISKQIVVGVNAKF